jgi:hypothetical protein
MGMKAVTFLLITLLLASSFVGISNAVTTHTLTADSGEISITAGIKAKVTYDADLTINKADSVLPGDSKSWDLQLSGGTLTLSIYVPFPIDKWYTISQSIPIGSYYDVPVSEGVSARVKILASTPISLEGQASVDCSSLTWESEGTQRILINVDNTAQPGSSVTINMPFTFNVNIGLVIGFWLFKYEVASTDIGHFSTNPVSESMRIESPINWALIISLAIATVSAICIVVILSLRRRASGKQYYYPPPPPPP